MVFHKISTVVYRIFCLAFIYSWTNNCRIVIVIWYVTRPCHIWVCLHSLEFTLCYNIVTMVGWVLGCMSLSADNIILHTWMYAILSWDWLFQLVQQKTYRYSYSSMYRCPHESFTLTVNMLNFHTKIIHGISAQLICVLCYPLTLIC